ncbi:glycosyltransferase family 2 protein [Phycicoccus sp. CSK15P-2]|uniref:glycosyltransferase family 2 protein n=1 Tax=Phycicoccus sp. CSK15P-2 TaxID=2807627 RepID=UPI001950C123|nr:glycosyltransferase family 2 protein [Phycicoccus sp. CSK15P-2]MBM6402943.1 glycosyltransferase family 2 protein [Phycicoccus sp. CSK15P-2]
MRTAAARYSGAAASAVGAATAGRWTTSALLPSVRRRPDRLAQYAIRVQSRLVRDALALAATAGTCDDAALVDLVLSGDDVLERWPGTPSSAWAACALAWAGRTDGSGLTAGADLYALLAMYRDPAELAVAHHVLAPQAQYLGGRRERVKPVLDRYAGTPPLVQGFLGLDLERPDCWDTGAGSEPHAEQSWSDHLRQLVFGHHPDVAVGVSGRVGEVAPFDRLDASGHVPASVSGDLVSVIVPSFRPEAAGMRLAVRSMLEQTWADLEVLVVDDASGPEWDDLYAEVEASDPRVRVVRMPDNGGSYVGRNAAMRLARGSAVTFQDSDDWSHPRRLEDQMTALASSPAVGASRSDALRAREDLSHQWLGYLPVRPNASSLMLRRSAVDALGDFLPIRRGADSEYAERVRAAGGEIIDTQTVLAITRLRSGSLSRGDFSYQWTTPQRLAFKGLFRSWHASSGPVGLTVDETSPLPFPVPAAFDVRPRERCFDLVVSADLSLPVAEVVDPGVETGTRVPSSDALTLDHEAMGLRAATFGAALEAAHAGARVAVWHVEAPSRRKGRSEMDASWFDLVTSGLLSAAVSGNEPVRARRLVVPDPRHLAVAPAEAVRIEADVVELLVADPARVGRDVAATDVDRMVVDDALSTAGRCFAGPVRVVEVASADEWRQELLERVREDADERQGDV